MIKTSAPGRICLFGEHQDYLHLPVITSAINLRITIQGKKRRERCFKIALPDIKGSEQFCLPSEGEELRYVKERDYFRSVFNVLLRYGARFGHGWDCTVQGNIPINSGTSSSSALCVAWTRFLCKASLVQKDEFSDEAFIGRIAYLAEVEEFGEPGGMMDQNASALGGVLYQHFGEPLFLKKLSVKLGAFVLGDSQEPKDTMAILKRVKFGVLQAVQKIKEKDADFKPESAKLHELALYKELLTETQMQVLEGALLNLDITRRALALFESAEFDERLFGELLNEHQQILAGRLKISTPKIERLLQAALDAGAYGGKINGSGGGGCMFVYAPENPAKASRAIEEAGGKAYIVKTDRGVRAE